MTSSSSASGTSPVQGLHHVTVMASDPQRNLDFYTQVLGQRLVKVTVNFDDPGTYHFYYGDLTGQPGTIMTHFPWPGASRGVRGNGEVVATAYSAPVSSYAAWQQRLQAHGLTGSESTRFGDPVLTFEDPDGTWVEIVFDNGKEVQPWPASPVPQSEALRGFHSVTAWVQETADVRALLVGQLGFQEVGTEADPQGPRTRFKGSGDGVGLYVDVVERAGQPRGSFGAGSVHHVALRTRNDAEQLAYLETLSAAGFRPTPVQDRQYFHSIYFREPNGVLFEIATDAPGFPADEAVEELGRHLKLPQWFEPQRAQIEAHVPRIFNHEYGVTIGSRDLSASAGQEPVGAADGIQVHVAGRPPSEVRVAMVLLHGRGGSAQDILSLERELNLSAFTYLAPQAPGNTWYPYSFLAPLEQNQPHLDQALATVDAVMEELAQMGIAPERVVLGGFSQGACLALEYASRAGRQLGGVVAFSGGLITLEQQSSMSGIPVFMGVDPDDAHIPLERFQATEAQLRARGASVDARVIPGLGHSINKEELDAARVLMQQVVAQSV
ncbi:VOC family protein [Deinococcus deserti]|uniref:Putative bifunctional protein: Dioxygenase Phospholipase/Carboxylesterase n=1 Tax=Deinococcus deserti (strain DSM 17065 / CIP 109153 / LMG 22923 / VCD115) TaxID=546414 RepID=C1D323_DEIDV|nr:VOC family protein [Deinococcus deserti]ACO47812.2 putative bifunctional protein : Dioxygenase; Phospholipase/Carboxylesterase [Deinococcus deserti VCD115]